MYVNFGRVEDFERLKQLGVNVTGKIAIMRYGQIYRGDKVMFIKDQKTGILSGVRPLQAILGRSKESPNVSEKLLEIPLKRSSPRCGQIVVVISPGYTGLFPRLLNNM